MSCSLGTVVVVSGQPEQEELLAAMLADQNDYDVVFVESIAHGYSRIKQVTPDLIILQTEIGDVAACQLLSMLTIDGDVSHIPVVTCVTCYAESGLEDDVVRRLDRRSPRRTLAVPMN